MSNIKLSAPKRRRGPRFDADPSVPVPVTRDTGEPPAVDNWNYYTGDLIDDHVLVRHSGDMDLLYRMGFFGKGNLSRNKPEYNEGFWTVRKRRRPGDSNEPYLRVVSKRQYLSHLAWKEQSVSGQAPPWEKKDLGKIKIKAKNKSFTHKSHEKLPTQTQADTESDVKDALVDRTQCKETQRTPEAVLPMEGQSGDALQTDIGWVSPQKEATDWPNPKEEESDPWAIEDQGDSSDFWGVGSTASTDGTHKKNSADFWGTSDDKDSKLPSSKTNNGYEDNKGSNHKQKPTDTEEKSESKKEDNTDKSRTYKADLESQTKPQSLPTGTTGSQQGLSNSASSALTAQQTDTVKAIPEERSPNNQNEMPAPESHNILDPNATQPQPVSPSKQLEAADPLPLSVTLDPQCQEEDAGGDLYVAEDSDDEQRDGEGSAGCEEGTKWIPTQKLDPYPLQECLQLTFEEAFFLSYGLGCLVVVDERKELLDLTAMWQIFSSRRKNFIQNYIAYHSLRSRGWVPKTGIKYGADFVIYHKGPAFYHGSYSVLVRSATQPDLRDDLDPANTALTWSGLMGIDRVTEQVAKEPLVMLVIRPRDLREEELRSPRCVGRFKVQEMLLRRWIPSKEREAAETAEWL